MDGVSRKGENERICYSVAESGRTLTIIPGDGDGPLLVVFDGDLWADNDFGFQAAMAVPNENATGPSPTAVLVSTPDRAILDKRETMRQLLTEEILPRLRETGDTHTIARSTGRYSLLHQSRCGAGRRH